MAKNTFNKLIKNKSAWIPLLMSGLALLEILLYVAAMGFYIPPQQGDENLLAHIFQFLLIFQIPIICYLAYKNFSKDPLGVIKIFVLQFTAALIPFTIVSLLEM